MIITIRRLAIVTSILSIELALVGCASQAPSTAAATPVAAAPIAAAPAADVKPVAADAKRLVPLEGALNVRHFTELRGQTGSIPATAFVRGADLSRLTTADRDALVASGVKLDVDLRTAEEATASPDALASDPRFQYLRVSLMGTEKLDLGNLPPTLGEGYVRWLGANQLQFREVFKAMAAQESGTVLFHCTAGKDRTGMIAALLLQLAGVARADVVHDYAISAHYLAPMMAAGSRQMTPQMAEAMKNNPNLAALRGSPPEAIDAFLKAVDRQYGGARGYLQTIGLDDSEIRRLQQRLGQAS